MELHAEIRMGHTHASKRQVLSIVAAVHGTGWHRLAQPADRRLAARGAPDLSALSMPVTLSSESLVSRGLCAGTGRAAEGE